MKENSVTDAELRQFLLGDVDEEERQRIESLFLTDAGLRDRILTSEQDLLEDYVDESLTAVERDKFLNQYGRTPEQRRKLKIAKSIDDWVNGERKAAPAASSADSFWDRLSATLGLKPVFLLPIAATVVIAVVFAVVWLNSRTAERNRQTALTQEIARLNEPSSLRETPPGMVSLTLRPGSVRGIETQQQLTKASDSQTVELRLVWPGKERYASYRVIVRRVSSGESFTSPNLSAENEANTIRLRLPAHLLTRGVYQLELTGIANDGASSRVEEYQFTVSD